MRELKWKTISRPEDDTRKLLKYKGYEFLAMYYDSNGDNYQSFCVLQIKKPNGEISCGGFYTNNILEAYVRDCLDRIDESTPDEPKKIGRPKKSPEEKVGGHKFNLDLDNEMYERLKATSWVKRLSVTQYIRNLIEKDMKENDGTV